MRELVGALVFLTLLLVGFLATPGVFKLVNPDYLLTLRDYRAPLAKLGGDLLDTNKKIDQADASISSLERSTAQLVADSNAKAATLSIANAPAEALAAAAAEYGRKAAGLKVDSDQAKAEKSGLAQQRKTLEDARAEMTKKIDASEAESTNLYLVTRALALGAIGALMSIFAKFLSTTRTPLIFGDKSFLARMCASMAMGGIVAVIVLGLFFTGFISIFSHAEPVSGNPDFWKVSILCLVAGAFSDRLFQAAAGRMDQYLGGIEGDVKPATNATQKEASPRKPSRRKASQARRGALRRG